MAMNYQRYPTAVKLHFAACTLPKEYFADIPSSTKYYWKQLKPSLFWKSDDDSLFEHDTIQLLRLHLQNKRLWQLVRMLVYLLALYKQLLKRFEITRPDFMAARFFVLLCVRYAKQTSLNIFKRKLPFSYKQFCAWTNGKNCRNSLLALCRKRHPLQLSLEEEKAIKQYCNDKCFEGWSLSSIYCKLLRDEKLHCHISTFYKYCRLLNITRKQKRFKKNYTPIAAQSKLWSEISTQRSLQILHIDVSVFRTADNLKQYLYVIRDNFSRAILACAAAAEYSSKMACSTLKGVLEKFGLMEKEGILITDDGSENKGAVTQMLNQPGMLWKRIIAQIDIVQSNSMVEAANKIIKHRFLYKQPIADLKELQQKLPAFIDAYNNTPMINLSAYTPNEVLSGAIPDFKRFEKNLFAARKKRLAANQNFTCTDTC
jgi:hypothetical protein